MSGARLAVKGVVSLSFLRDLHPLHSHQLAWRTTILPPTGIDPLLLARIERRPAHLDLTRYPHLPQPFVAATRAGDYASLLAGGAGRG